VLLRVLHNQGPTRSVMAMMVRLAVDTHRPSPPCTAAALPAPRCAMIASASGVKLSSVPRLPPPRTMCPLSRRWAARSVRFAGSPGFRSLGSIAGTSRASGSRRTRRAHSATVGSTPLIAIDPQAWNQWDERRMDAQRSSPGLHHRPDFSTMPVNISRPGRQFNSVPSCELDSRRCRTKYDDRRAGWGARE
jgi:hypothetical protein